MLRNSETEYRITEEEKPKYICVEVNFIDVMICFIKSHKSCMRNCKCLTKPVKIE